MPPNDKANSAPRPDSPRQYHDDYPGKQASRTRTPIVLAALAGLLLICAALYIFSQGVAG